MAYPLEVFTGCSLSGTSLLQLILSATSGYSYADRSRVATSETSNDSVRNLLPKFIIVT